MRTYVFNSGLPWRAFTILGAVAAFSVARADGNFRVAWTRSSSSSDITMDVIHDGKLTDGEYFTVAGGSKQPNGSFKGNISKFNRNRNLNDFVEVSPPGGGSLQFFKIRQFGGFYYAVGEAFPTGSTDGQIYIGKFDANLNLVAEHMEPATASAGFEMPTGFEIDANGNLYICGVAQKGVKYEMYLESCNSNLGSLNFNYQKIDLSEYSEPQIALNGIIAILIGLATDTGPTLRSYQPAGPLNYSFGASQTGSWLRNVNLLCKDGSAFLCSGQTEEVEGTPHSFGLITKIDIPTGVWQDDWETPYVAGTGIVSPRDIASGQATGKSVNVMYDQGNRARIYSFDHDLGLTGDWISPTTSVFSAGLMIDQYNELFGALCNNEAVKSSYGFKLNSNDVLRFSWGMSQTGLMVNNMEAGSMYEPNSGDICQFRSDSDSMQLVCIQQAPVAVTDGVYQAKSGKLFRPVNPVTNNDRYAGGATIAITQQPMHGTVTIGPTGFFNYTSTSGFVGTDTFHYTLTKTGLNPSTATVNLNVKP